MTILNLNVSLPPVRPDRESLIDQIFSALEDVDFDSENDQETRLNATTSENGQEGEEAQIDLDGESSYQSLFDDEECASVSLSLFEFVTLVPAMIQNSTRARPSHDDIMSLISDYMSMNGHEDGHEDPLDPRQSSDTSASGDDSTTAVGTSAPGSPTADLTSPTGGSVRRNVSIKLSLDTKALPRPPRNPASCSPEDPTKRHAVYFSKAVWPSDGNADNEKRSRRWLSLRALRERIRSGVSGSS
ncbi:hypothetical protein K474DRAFT_1112028 [Panus rudis PR-1116 ss-1]|nr:hypothetical protein K474DRAFT_1112028 [Panus rudis PR-1116 ss-1]